MNRLKKHKNKLPYIIFAILSVFSISLIFNNNIWFDEAYTLSLIKHSYLDMIEILGTDMHPPLYFISLKSFCVIFGYSIQMTKVFSVIGYIATLLLGLTIIKKHFGRNTSLIYLLTIGATPMLMYFSVQQRSYQWCIFFVTFCFVEGLLFLKTNKIQNCIIFVFAGLFSAYNHIYALLATGIIFAFINFYIFIKSRKQIKVILFADLAMFAGYSPWILPLLNQTTSASKSFWLSGVEPLSVIVFASGIIISALLLINKKSRKLSTTFAISCVLGIQSIGLFVTIFIRPFYIARYSVVIAGIFALMIAFAVSELNRKFRNTVCVILCILSIACEIVTVLFEYNPSMNSFFEYFNESCSSSDTFIYCDNSFGIMSHYYPDNTHLCTYKEEWFSAFDNVECIDKKDIADKINNSNKVWFVKDTLKRTPKYLSKNYTLNLFGTFICDLNTFEVYMIQK